MSGRGGGAEAESELVESEAASGKKEDEWVPWEGGLGGDPCSSTYNTDPFDEQGDKPDAWEEMKKRIQAKVDRDKKAEEEMQGKKK